MDFKFLWTGEGFLTHGARVGTLHPPIEFFHVGLGDVWIFHLDSVLLGFENLIREYSWRSDVAFLIHFSFYWTWEGNLFSLKFFLIMGLIFCFYLYFGEVFSVVFPSGISWVQVVTGILEVI